MRPGSCGRVSLPWAPRARADRGDHVAAQVCRAPGRAAWPRRARRAGQCENRLRPGSGCRATAHDARVRAREQAGVRQSERERTAGALRAPHGRGRAVSSRWPLPSPTRRPQRQGDPGWRATSLWSGLAWAQAGPQPRPRRRGDSAARDGRGLSQSWLGSETVVPSRSGGRAARVFTGRAAGVSLVTAARAFTGRCGCGARWPPHEGPEHTCLGRTPTIGIRRLCGPVPRRMGLALVIAGSVPYAGAVPDGGRHGSRRQRPSSPHRLVA